AGAGMMRDVGRSRLYGREPELARLDELIEDVGKHGRVLVVRGEAGIGKSALIAHARERAVERGMRVLTTVGVESEAQLPFAGLPRLPAPAWAGAGRVPGPARPGGQAGFGLVGGAGPGLFLVPLAGLDLIAEMASHAPLLLVVEDAHWLDSATCRVLT